MNPNVPVWGLDVSDRAVTAVRVRREADGPTGSVEILDHWSVPVPPGADPLTVALDAVRKRRLRDHALQFVLPGRGAVCRTFRISPEDADLSPRDLERELHDFHSLPPEDVLLRARRLGGREALDFLVVVERRAVLGAAEQAIEAAGIRTYGLTLAAVARLNALEATGIGPERGYVLAVGGASSTLIGVEGRLLAGHGFPAGLEGVQAGVARIRPDLAWSRALDAHPGEGAAGADFEALREATAPLGADVVRAIDFHRASVPGTGEETLLVVGPETERKGLRSALAHHSPVPLHPLLRPEALERVRFGPRIDPEDGLRRLPALVTALGGALAGCGTAARDLDFKDLPEDLVAPVERTVWPVAVAVLLAGFAASWWLANDARAAVARPADGAPAAAVTAPAVATDPAGNDTTPADNDVTDLLARAARETRRTRVRAAVLRTTRAVLECLPPVDDTAVQDLTVAGLALATTDDAVTATLRIRREVPPPTRAGTSAFEPLLGSLLAAGWSLETVDGSVATLRRHEAVR